MLYHLYTSVMCVYCIVYIRNCDANRAFDGAIEIF